MATMTRLSGSPALPPRQVWHVGFIVDNLEDAMSEFSDGLGLTWAEPHHIKASLSGPNGEDYPLDTRVVFSLDTPLSVELIEPTPGTPNVRRGESAFHHLGYWADDLVDEEHRLSDLGLGCVAFRNDDNDLRRIMLSEGPYGILLEATNTRTARPGLEQFYPAATS